MRDVEDAEALTLIEKAVLAIQSRHHLAGRCSTRWTAFGPRSDAPGRRFRMWPHRSAESRREARMARSQRSRYGHPFSSGKSAVAFRGQTAMRGKPPSAQRVTPMPHPEYRVPYQVSPDLAPLRVGEVIDGDMRIKISCDNCNRETLWTRGFMEKRLRRQRAFTVDRLAARLRCGGCRSNYIRVWRA